MMSCVRSLVSVIQHGRCAGCIEASPMNENTGTGRSSPNCASRLVKSIDRPSMRGGVPVFSRPCGSFNSRKRAASDVEAGSPARPPAWLSSPTWIFPLRKVPTVRTTEVAEKRTPECVTAPTTRPPSIVRSSTDCWNNQRLDCRSSRRRMAVLYSTRSAWDPRGANRRTLATVENAELDAGLVRRQCHRAAERIDLPDEVALADPADRRIAAHRAERLDALRQQQRTGAHARRRRERGLRTGVTAANHQDVEDFGIVHDDFLREARLSSFSATSATRRFHVEQVVSRQLNVCDCLLSYNRL